VLVVVAFGSVLRCSESTASALHRAMPYRQQSQSVAGPKPSYAARKLSKVRVAGDTTATRTGSIIWLHRWTSELAICTEDL
jgi:hypothetical protein